MRVRGLKMIPVEVVIRNRIAGSMAKRLGAKRWFKSKFHSDKDVFRRDLGDLLEAYSEVLKRLGG